MTCPDCQNLQTVYFQNHLHCEPCFYRLNWITMGKRFADCLKNWDFYGKIYFPDKVNGKYEHQRL
jgi:hypothetical protein